ncbi:hypothetical protein D3C86_717240 [compost metagenome]
MLTLPWVLSNIKSALKQNLKSSLLKVARPLFSIKMSLYIPIGQQEDIKWDYPLGLLPVMVSLSQMATRPFQVKRTSLLVLAWPLMRHTDIIGKWSYMPALLQKKNT